MKALLILVTLLAFVNLAKAATEENDNENEVLSTIDKLKSTQYVEKTIVPTDQQTNTSDLHRDFCPKRVYDVIDYLKVAGFCFDGIGPNVTLCGSLRAHLTECAVPIAEQNDRCLPEKSKGISMLIVNGLLSLLNHTCTLSGDRFFEVLNPCILPSEKNVDNLNILTEKIENLTTVNFKRKVDDFSLQDMCNIGENIGKFWSEHVHKSCTNQFTRDVFIELFQAAYAPCTEIGKTKRINNQ